MSYIGPNCLGSSSFRSPSRRRKMQEVIAGLERFTFAFEKDVEMQKGTGLLPFQGMDKSASAVCNFFTKGLCEKGKLCPFRHDRGEKMVVCKHWLRGLCKKGDHCKFLHQYDLTRMPECYFYSKFGPLCKYRHVPRIMCLNYLVGFCPEGPKCQFAQVLKYEICSRLAQSMLMSRRWEGESWAVIVSLSTSLSPKMNLSLNPSYRKPCLTA
ncbi:putative cleavage and polyadenylation specificity factor subunit 4-like protein isoform X2 [Hylobates moloch]|uniref:putative cleavage and polyadenylation specificity factor subunit 4-like protein isoform X2 n=1 Tax=Hylobates moloch TaxID=81572 RepID=UPI0026756B5C|nr:putative cleavage and polyadenylation specificity factor subunit 4-like protein isoform X2 [Hylobates moloch]